jgi:carboxymethylenebutenolidase
MTIETRSRTIDGLNAYLARPTGGASAGMLLIPMITGIGEQVREFAAAIAEAGVTTLAWDPWRGRGTSEDTPMETLFTWMGELDDDACLGEQTRLLDYLLDELGCTKVGVIGWCLGGRFALILGGQDSRVPGVVAYHPTVPGKPAPNHTVDVVEHAARISAPVMMLYPGADDLVPVESFHRLQTALNSRASGPSIVHVYPGAEHGFSARRRHGNPVNSEAFAISWPQVVDFVKVTTGS